ncbi:hypothetical protein FACS1894153_3860 [Bacteroidia bacterium]|nr:hypothetical protein FACS1894153_3860 [Bacteroidia bacterium]
MHIKSLFLVVFSLSFLFNLNGQATLRKPALPEEQTFLRYEIKDFTKALSVGANCVWDFSNTDIIEIERGGNVYMKSHLSEDTLFTMWYDGRWVYSGFFDKQNFILTQQEHASQRYKFTDIPRLFLKYPLKYKEFFSSEYKGDLSKPTRYEPYNIQGFSTTELVGYGNLILPTNRILNEVFLLRIQSRYIKIDSIEQNSSQEIYAFYTSESFFPIIEIVTDKQHKGQEQTEKQTCYFYEVEQALTANFSPKNVAGKDVNNQTHITQIKNSFVSPNPAFDMVKLDFVIVDKAEVNMIIESIDGRMIDTFSWQYSMSGDYSQNIYLSTYNLPSGTYLFIVKINGNSEVHKVQKI